MAATDSGPCPVAGFDISNLQPSVSLTSEVVDFHGFCVVLILILRHVISCELRITSRGIAPSQPPLLVVFSTVRVSLLVTEISKGESWSGRACCPLPQSEKCQHACVTAATRQDLVHSCRQSDELAFVTCLDRQEVSCCHCLHLSSYLNSVT